MALPRQLPASDVLDLQRQVGNQAVAALLSCANGPAVQRRKGRRPVKVDKDLELWDAAFNRARRLMEARNFVGAERILALVYENPRFTTASTPGIVVNLALTRHVLGKFADAVGLYQESLLVPSYGEEARRDILENLKAARLGTPPVAGLGGSVPTKSAKRDLDLWDAAFKRARKLIAAKNFAGAEKLLRLVYSDPHYVTADTPGVVLNLARVRHELGDLKEAIELYRESLAVPSFDAEARAAIAANLRAARLGRPPVTAEAGVPDQADEQLWDDTFKLARKRVAAGDFAGAQKLLISVYSDPKFTIAAFPGVVLNLGLTRHALGSFAGAISLYEEALGGGSYTATTRAEILENLKAARLGKPPVAGLLTP